MNFQNLIDLEVDMDDNEFEEGDEHDAVFENIKESLSKIDDGHPSSHSLSSTGSNGDNETVHMSEHFTNVPYGIQPRDTYEHGKNCADIMGGNCFSFLSF